MPKELTRLAASYLRLLVWREITKLAVPVGLVGAAGWMLMELHRSAQKLIGG